jgi:subfamily B ATP-binding cassette protein MsbA
MVAAKPNRARDKPLTADSPAPRAQLSTQVLVGRLVREHVRPYFRHIALAIACMVVLAATTATYAWLMEPILNEIFENKDRTMLVVLPLAVIVLFLIKGAAGYGQAVLMRYVGLRITTDMRIRLFTHLMPADLAFYHNTATGELISRLTNDLKLVRKAGATALTGMIKEFLTLVFLVAVMFYQNWPLALSAAFVFPLAVLPIVRIGRRMRKTSTKTQVKMGRFTTILNETFQGVRHVKAYGMEDYEIDRATGAVEQVFRLLIKKSRLSALTTPIMENLGGIAIAMVIFIGGWQVIEGQTTTGAFFSFITALLLALRPINKLAGLNVGLQEGLAAAARVFTLLDTEPDIKDRPGARPLEVDGGVIALDQVGFSYGRGVPALEGVSLMVPAGKTAALVGPSGAGKSTIFNLILRFYEVESGHIRIDGADVRDVTLASLRGAIGLVSQEVTLFNDTVRANIAYGRLDADDDEIEAAARGAAADEFIRALPDGYDTVVGEHGVKLSAGQRQRVAIARAMLKNAPILLLDEATSALDSESERLVQQALSRLLEGRTTLVIAHRLSTVIGADVIYVIENGRVVESGAHSELLAKSGAYARLHDIQYADDVASRGMARARA